VLDNGERSDSNILHTQSRRLLGLSLSERFLVTSSVVVMCL
jgi:hypothetical protein